MFAHYLLSALRRFRRQKLATLVNVLCLALGLACIAYVNRGDEYFARADRIQIVTADVEMRESRQAYSDGP